jgi:BMFP domain-containing protein YqiC
VHYFVYPPKNDSICTTKARQKRANPAPAAFRSPNSTYLIFEGVQYGAKILLRAFNMSDFTQRIFSELQNALPGADALPRAQLQAALESVVRRMDLVTRADFDAQAAVLARTRARLEALEAEVAKLERNIDPSPSQS